MDNNKNRKLLFGFQKQMKVLNVLNMKNLSWTKCF